MIIRKRWRRNLTSGFSGLSDHREAGFKKTISPYDKATGLFVEEFAIFISMLLVTKIVYQTNRKNQDIFSEIFSYPGKP
jgi:hypothetical protein